MSKEKNAIGIFTSGGDAPGMNACIRALVRSCEYFGYDCYGFQEGYEGLIDGNYKQLKSEDVNNIIHLGGTILGSSRSVRFRTTAGRDKAAAQVKKLGIRAIIGIGGDGTYRGLQAFTEQADVQIIGIPGAIDNDISGTDATLGYDTALNTAIEAIDRIRDTAKSHHRLFFVEVMGRYAGHLALAAGVGGGAEAILIPEEKTHIDELVEKLNRSWEEKRPYMIVVVAEGDDAGDAFTVAKKVRELGVPYETKVTVLGHIQRGGSPSAFDRLLSAQFGALAVKSAHEGKSHVITSFKDGKYCLKDLSAGLESNKSLDTSFLKVLKITSS